MVESYRAQVGSVLEVLAEGLAPFVDRHMRRYFEGQDWIVEAATRMGKREPMLVTATDPQFQLEVMIRWWGPVFAKVLSDECRTTVQDLRTARNEWAHFVEDRPIDLDHASQVHLQAEDLLRQVGSPLANDVSKLRHRLRLDAARSLAEQEGISEADVLAKQLTDLHQQRTELEGQLDLAREEARSAAGRSRAVARQLADLQSQYAAVAGLRDQYLELKERLEEAERRMAPEDDDPTELRRELSDVGAAADDLQTQSAALSAQLDEARRALEDPVQTPAGRRWVMLVAALVMALGVAIILLASSL